MLYPSILFILYFLPAALLLYLACSFSRSAQNLCLLLISLIFYAWGEPLHLLPLSFVILVSYGLGMLLTNDKLAPYRQKVVVAAVLLIMGTLLLARYAGVLVAEVSGLAGLQLEIDFPEAPLGVAFFTLQALSYVLDVSRGKVEREKNIINVGLFIALFPTVLAGPILRYSDIAAQIKGRKVTPALLGKGSARFVIGFAKLVLLAAPLSLIANHVFTMSSAGSQMYDVPVMLAWLGLFAFSLQIYLGFSAYSDMAVGLAALFGFSIRDNFNYPYTALTITEFWKRWHISLFAWFHKYVYAAMGGSRPQLVRVRGAETTRNLVLRNLFVLWLLIGLWHGLDWSFFIWGMWFFVFFLFEWTVRLGQRKVSGAGWRVYTLLVIAVSWVFFRCHSVGESMNYLSNMLGLSSNGLYSELAVIFVKENWLPLLAGVLFCTPVAKIAENWIADEKAGAARYPLVALYPLVLAGLFCLSMIFLIKGGHIPFII